MSKINCLILILPFLLFQAGCSLHQVNREPQPFVSLPDQYEAADKTFVKSDPVVTDWWKNFNRPALNVLIQEAYASNQELVQAFSRVKQAKTYIKESRALRRPELSVTAEAADQWIDDDEQGYTAQGEVEFRWEIDLFRRLQSDLEARQETFLARKEDYLALKLIIASEISRAYFGAVAENNRLDLLEEQVALDQKLLELLELRLENGYATNVEILQQKNQLAESESFIPRAEAQLRLYENSLDVLLGSLPDGKNRVSQNEQLDFDIDLDFVGVPADLIINRPDLRSLKAQLIAVDANIASAIAERFPHFTLNGSSIYSEGTGFNGLISSITANFIQPLLDWGRREARVRRNRAAYEEKLAEYTQAFLTAVEEVENALYTEERQREFITRLEQRKQILDETVKQTEERYERGVDDYLPVINALQQLRRVERDIISERLNLIDIRIRLHRAVGGDVQ